MKCRKCGNVIEVPAIQPEAAGMPPAAPAPTAPAAPAAAGTARPRRPRRRGDAGRAAEALPWHERQLALAREADNRHEEANAINNIGNAHRALHRDAEAKASYERYLAIVRELGHPVISTSAMQGMATMLIIRKSLL